MMDGRVTNVTKINPRRTPAGHARPLRLLRGRVTRPVGPSGCGKTTLLRMIAGLEEVTTGEIAIDGRVVTHLAPRERNVAMVFQNYALYPHMSVRRNIGYGLKVRGVPRREIAQRVEKVA